MYHVMDTQEPKVKINARLDADLHKWVLAEGLTVSQAVNDGITLLRETRQGERDTEHTERDTGRDTERDTTRDTGTQGHTETIKNDNDINVSQALRERIEDQIRHIELISEQLSRKDEQITQLNEVTQKQAVHIQSLIQENSKLNTKLLPEVIDKKPWWKFW